VQAEKLQQDRGGDHVGQDLDQVGAPVTVQPLLDDDEA
jgi:hypothetical protein